MDASPKLIGEYLIAAKKIKPAQLQKALELQANSIQGGRMPLLGTILIQLGIIDARDLDLSLAQQERDRKELNPANYPPEVMAKIKNPPS